MVDVALEVLRLYPSVPINSRTANRTTTLPTGGGSDGTTPVLVRKGEAVGYCPYIMHRRQEIFGPDAEAFRPDRWLEEGGRLFSTVGFGYLPFNGGPRVCLGRESNNISHHIVSS
jgi:cytochrome P450